MTDRRDVLQREFDAMLLRMRSPPSPDRIEEFRLFFLAGALAAHGLASRRGVGALLDEIEASLGPKPETADAP